MKKITERLIALKKSNDNFDLEFWQKAGSEARFSATWLMIDEFYKIKRKNAGKLRLQRSVQNIEQI